MVIPVGAAPAVVSGVDDRSLLHIQYNLPFAGTNIACGLGARLGGIHSSCLSSLSGSADPHRHLSTFA